MRKVIFLTTFFALSIFFLIRFEPLFKSKGPSIFPEASLTEGPYDGPAEFIKFHNGIRTREGESTPGYEPGFKIIELQKAKFNQAKQARNSVGAELQASGIEWTERGPVNVPGRTRGLLVDPDDATKNTWFAGSASGGVWKTTNGGTNWTLITPDLSNLATTVLVMAGSNHNVIYLGTGEGFGNLDGVSGNGIFKSIDRGQSWTYLPSTSTFDDINRAIVSPVDPGIVIVATNNGIYRTTNGGNNWTQVSSLPLIEDLNATQGNFSVQYATQKTKGVLKSTDGGINWALSNTGMSPSGRIEIDISPVDPNRIFASAEGTLSGSKSDLYVSNDAGVTWTIVDVSFNNATIDFLGGQGWYDNAIACDPFNADIVYVGGVNIFRLQLGTGSTSVTKYNVEENNTSFMNLVNFNANQYQGKISVGTGTNKNVEVRFGPGKSQLAHRFTVPPAGGTNQNGGPGVPDNQYIYQDYASVPFEVWEIDNGGNDVRQLMVSFRDQERDGQFNLKKQDAVNDPDLLTSREYIFIHDISYQSTPASLVAINGGQVVSRMYFFWPVLSTGKKWPDDIVPSNLRILVSSIPKLNAVTTTVTDAYGQFDKKNSFVNSGVDVHPDHHTITMIPVNNLAYKILIANDGGLFISNTSETPGIAQGNWTMVGRTFNTAQFYGADKQPKSPNYLGGTQDNGTWYSSSSNTTATTSYRLGIGGDGFEAIWHNLDQNLMIGSSQGNAFRRSSDGGQSWAAATTGLTGDMPFISKLANSRDFPDRIFTVGTNGVFVSVNFGLNWSLTPITSKWGASSFLDVEVSRANANIVWAGSGMSTTRNLYVSVNGGSTFTQTTNFTGVKLGTISKLASNPFEPSTGYALFSFADTPKILRTTNLGQTWQDISGFGNGTESTTGFPDVATYCLYVRPDNPNIIWVGTEIGIVESQDNGQSWALLAEFPKVAVWDMKGQDDEVVIATHGRGIWTAKIAKSQLSSIPPQIIDAGTAPTKKLMLKVRVDETYDSLQTIINGVLAGSVKTLTMPSTLLVSLSGVTPGQKEIKVIGYKGGAPHHSANYSANQLNVLNTIDSYSNYFETNTDLFLDGFFSQTMPGNNSKEKQSLQTTHNYSVNKTYLTVILHPVKVSGTFSQLFYRDIIIIEPVNDSFVVEATKDGITWLPLIAPYDASANPLWADAFANGKEGRTPMFVSHQLDLKSKFAAGDEVLIRLRMASNSSIAGWGCAIDFMSIQELPVAVEPAITKETTVTVFPNPSTGVFNLNYHLKNPFTVTAQVVNSLGQIVVAKNFGYRMAGEHKDAVSLEGEPGGMYLIVISTDTGKKTIRVVLTGR